MSVYVLDILKDPHNKKLFLLTNPKHDYILQHNLKIKIAFVILIR